MLLAGAGVNLAGLVAVVAASNSGSIWLTSAVAVVAGAAQPSLTSAFRALCATRLTDPRTRTAAYSMDAIGIEVTFVIGPPSPPQPLLLADLTWRSMVPGSPRFSGPPCSYPPRVPGRCPPRGPEAAALTRSASAVCGC